jgi:hypothetical protein
MNGSKVFDIVASIVAVALITTLILPNRQTGQVINQGGRAFSGGLQTAMTGRSPYFRR